MAYYDVQEGEHGLHFELRLTELGEQVEGRVLREYITGVLAGIELATTLTLLVVSDDPKIPTDPVSLPVERLRYGSPFEIFITLDHVLRLIEADGYFVFMSQLANIFGGVAAGILNIQAIADRMRRSKATNSESEHALAEQESIRKIAEAVVIAREGVTKGFEAFGFVVVNEPQVEAIVQRHGLVIAKSMKDVEALGTLQEEIARDTRRP